MSSWNTTTLTIELQQLLRKEANTEKKSWQDGRNSTKQVEERKLHEFSPLEKMKFSHSIQFNAVPDWSSHYIAYSNLKKLYADAPYKAPSPSNATIVAMVSLG